MKKIVAIALTLVMAGCGLAGCGQTTKETKTEAETAEAGAPQVAGGWTISEACGAELPEEAKTAFDKALEGYAGMGFEPITLLGTQVVAGINYAILAKGTTVTATPETSLKVVIVYAGVDGTNEIRNVADFNIDEYTEDKDIDVKQLAGGWTVADTEGFALPDDVQKAFDKAFEGFAGAGYTPLAFVGSQVVAGANYLVLCRETLVTAEPVTKLSMVKIYADLQDSAEVTSVCAIDIADFNK